MTALVTDAAEAAEGRTPGDAGGDRRAGGKRHQSVLLVGRVVDAPGAPACLVHDISRSGLMARFATPPAVGDVLVIEVRGLPPVTGTVRWVRGAKAGLQFAEPQDVERVFALRRADGTVARAPRFPLYRAGVLRGEGRRWTVEALDISAGGAKLALADGGEGITVGQAGALTLSGIDDPIYGTVCWLREGKAGIRFAAPLPLTLLTRILAG